MAKDISILAKRKKIAVVGAGIGGLVSALKLAHEGFEVKVFESSDYPGGKIRTIDSSCGPVNRPNRSNNAYRFSKSFQRSRRKHF